jgi:hypothetical protein
LMVFSQSSASSANAGMWARLVKICSVAGAIPRYDRSGIEDMKTISDVAMIERTSIIWTRI